MKAILLPLVLALAAAEARADHSSGFSFRIGFGELCFGTPRISIRAPAFPCPPVRCEPAGHYEFRERRVYVPGTYESVWVAPTYGFRTVGFRKVKVCLRPGRFERVLHEGYYRTERYRVWVPAPAVCD